MPILEKLVPIACISMAVLVLSPFGFEPFTLSEVLIIHIISYFALGLCFELPELSLNALCLYLAGREDRFARNVPLIARTLNIRYVLTHFIGPSTGIFVVASGTYLAYRGGFSFHSGWLFWVLAVAVIGLYKGMYQHNAYVKGLFRLSKNKGDKNLERLRHGLLNPFDQVLIFLEFPTYVFIYWAASIKPLWLHNPLASLIDWFEHAGSVWTAGVWMIASGSLLLLPLHWGMQCWSFPYKKYGTDI